MFPRLAERRDQLAGSMSGGEQQMLAIARALMARPKLVLLDEPSLGLAPIITQELFRTLGALNREQGISMLVVEQNAGLALEIAARGYVLETGSIVVSGSAAELAGNDDVRTRLPGDLTTWPSSSPSCSAASRTAPSTRRSRSRSCLIFRTTGILNFAQGEMALFSTYIVWKFTDDGHAGLARDPPRRWRSRSSAAR